MNITAFKQKLTDSGLNYELLNTSGNGYLRFRFIGEFLGEPIIWDAHLYTLAYYVYEVANLSQPKSSVRQFIHVGDVDKMGRKIEIGLSLSLIDEPVIIKTMIMVRQYKRLTNGRHEYGETISV